MAKRSAKRSVKRSFKRSVKRSVKRSAKRSVKRRAKRSAKRSAKKSIRGGKSMRPPLDISVQLAILDKFAKDALSENDTIKELYAIYWLPPPPIDNNLKFKKETLAKFKKGELDKETAEKMLRTMFKIRGEYVVRNNKPANKPVKKELNKKELNKKELNKVKKVSVKKE